MFTSWNGLRYQQCTYYPLNVINGIRQRPDIEVETRLIASGTANSRSVSVGPIAIHPNTIEDVKDSQTVVKSNEWAVTDALNKSSVNEIEGGLLG